MPASEFLDTNVLVYAYDPGDSHKQRVAQDLVRRALAGDILVSTQVLAEFAATLLHKMEPAARAEDVAAVLDALSPIGVVVPDADIVRRAVEVRAEYGVHFYDGMIGSRGAGRLWADLVGGSERRPEIFRDCGREPLPVSAAHLPASSVKSGAPAEANDLVELFAPVRGLFADGELDFGRNP